MSGHAGGYRRLGKIPMLFSAGISQQKTLFFLTKVEFFQGKNERDESKDFTQFSRQLLELLFQGGEAKPSLSRSGMGFLNGLTCFNDALLTRVMLPNWSLQ